VNSRPGEPPSSRSAASTAATSEAVPDPVLANLSLSAKACQAAPSGLLVPNSATAWRASSRNCSPVTSPRDDPMI